MPDDTLPHLQKLLELLMHRSMKHFVGYLKQRDLSMSHIGTLFMVHREGACGVSEIGEHLGITPAGTSQMLNRLVEEGLIERTEDAQDRRAKRIVLTHKGKETLHESILARQQWLHQLVEALDPGQRELVSQALEILVGKATDFEPGGLEKVRVEEGQ
jgi:DNA-binding MarR family transcriptional regulator